jgi:hypothetical protein
VNKTETSRINIKQTEGSLRSNINADQSGNVEERPQPQAGKVITPNLKLFKLEELKSATRNFRYDTVLGEGSFGRVFKGWVDGTTYAPSTFGAGVAVAVKKLNPDSIQGWGEWLVRLFLFLGSFNVVNIDYETVLFLYLYSIFEVEKLFLLSYYFLVRKSHSII